MIFQQLAASEAGRCSGGARGFVALKCSLNLATNEPGRRWVDVDGDRGSGHSRAIDGDVSADRDNPAVAGRQQLAIFARPK